jgi:hypothetical protein
LVSAVEKRRFVSQVRHNNLRLKEQKKKKQKKNWRRQGVVKDTAFLEENI